MVTMPALQHVLLFCCALALTPAQIEAEDAFGVDTIVPERDVDFADDGFTEVIPLSEQASPKPPNTAKVSNPLHGARTPWLSG